MKEILEHLKECGAMFCKAEALFDISCRHGREFPACEKHVFDELERAFEYDGDHGRVTVYRIGVSDATFREVAIYGLEH